MRTASFLVMLCASVFSSIAFLFMMAWMFDTKGVARILNSDLSFLLIIGGAMLLVHFVAASFLLVKIYEHIAS